MQMPDYVLMAEGGILLPTLTIVLHRQGEKTAIEEAQRIAKSLAVAGYKRFVVYKTESDGERLVATFSTETEVKIVAMKDW